MSSLGDEYIPRPGEFDPLAEAPESTAAANEPSDHPKSKASAPLIRFYKPSELRAYQPPADQCLVGDYHLQRGALAVLAGPPGCGKSRAALQLGILGARGTGDWFGLQVHTRFRTLMLQNENGLARLHRDLQQIDGVEELDDWLRISAPPTYGLALGHPQFRAELKAMVRDFAPNLLVLDPWNACVRDAMEKDFQEALSRVREVLAEAPGEPCSLILHHLRKPKAEDRHKGRNLAHLLSGSYVLVSVARSVLVMQPATDDTEDARVVVTCAKNNDGALGPRSAWERRDGSLFVPVTGFDWGGYDGEGARREPKVREEHLRELFKDGGTRLALKQAAERLQDLAEVGRSAAYEALRLDGGRFSALLYRASDGLIGFKAGALAACGNGEAELGDPL